MPMLKPKRDAGLADRARIHAGLESVARPSDLGLLICQHNCFSHAASQVPLQASPRLPLLPRYSRLPSRPCHINPTACHTVRHCPNTAMFGKTESKFRVSWPRRQVVSDLIYKACPSVDSSPTFLARHTVLLATIHVHLLVVERQSDHLQSIRRLRSWISRMPFLATTTTTMTTLNMSLVRPPPPTPNSLPR